VIDEDWAEVFSINVFLKSSPVLKDGTPPDDAEDPEEAAKLLKFPWHSEKGIIGNTRMLNEEFNKFRGLNPVKVFITGPPASGKSHYGARISQYYNIPHITVKDAAALLSTMKGEWADGVREQIEAKKDEIFEELEKKAKKGQEPKREDIEVRLEDKVLYTLMRAKLNENACRNRGYILDGYPRSFRDAQKVFLIKKKRMVKNEDGEMVEAEEEEEEPDSAEEEGDEPVPPEEKKEKNYENYETDPAITPSSVLRMDAEDDFLKQRVKDLPEEKVQGTHWTDADLDRRLKAYREANNSSVDDPSLTSFFEKHGIEVHASSAADEEEKVFEGQKIFIERIERPKNFMTFDQERE
jgi:adenylate kinase